MILLFKAFDLGKKLFGSVVLGYCYRSGFGLGSSVVYVDFFVYI